MGALLKAREQPVGVGAVGWQQQQQWQQVTRALPQEALLLHGRRVPLPPPPQ